jgi:hypothetical protein
MGERFSLIFVPLGGDVELLEERLVVAALGLLVGGSVDGLHVLGNLVGIRLRLRVFTQLWLGVAVLVELPLEVGQQIKHRSGLFLAEVLIESCPWLGVLDIDDDLGVVPHGLSSATRTSVRVVSLAPLVFWLPRHWLPTPTTSVGAVGSEQSR